MNLIGPQVDWQGQAFALGAAGVNDVISAAGQTIALPHIQATRLLFLGAGIGSHANQAFTVKYTDNSTAVLT